MAKRMGAKSVFTGCACLAAVLAGGCAFHPEGLYDWSKPIISYERNSPLGYMHQLGLSVRDEMLLTYYSGWEPWDPAGACPAGWVCVRDRKMTESSLARQIEWNDWRSRCEYAPIEDAYCWRGHAGRKDWRYDAPRYDPYRYYQSPYGLAQRPGSGGGSSFDPPNRAAGTGRYGAHGFHGNSWRFDLHHRLRTGPGRHTDPL